MNPLSGVLGEAWKIYRSYAAHLLSIAFVIYLVAAIITALLSLAGVFGSLLGTIVELVAAFLVQAALVKAIQDVRDGRVDPGRHRDHDRAHPDHRPWPHPDHYLGRDRARDRHRAVGGAGVLRAQPGTRPWPRMAGVRHAGAGVPDPHRRGHRDRAHPAGPAAGAAHRYKLRGLRNPRRPVPRGGRHADLLPARRRPQRGGPSRRLRAAGWSSRPAGKLRPASRTAGWYSRAAGRLRSASRAAGRRSRGRKPGRNHPAGLPGRRQSSRLSRAASGWSRLARVPVRIADALLQPASLPTRTGEDHGRPRLHRRERGRRPHGGAVSAAGPSELSDVPELRNLALSRSDVDRATARRGDDEWLAAAWGDPRTRVLVVDHGQAMVRFGADIAELLFLPPAQAPEGVRFLQGIDADGIVYFGVAAALPQ